MDQLIDAFGIDWKLFIAQAINFGVLLIILWLVLYKPTMKVLDERQKKIQQGVEDAEKATQKLQGADTEAAHIVSKADQEAGVIVNTARERAQEEKAKLVKEAEARALQIQTDAELRAKETQEKARKDSEKEIARLAVLAAGKALEEKA